jgi:dihydroorotate dehydrogenase (fumarate)
MRLFLQRCAHFFYKHLVKPILFRFSPDKTHDGMINFSAWAGKNRFFSWFIRFSMKYDNSALRLKLTRMGGLEFSNPIGLGAGFDKNALTASPIEGIGFGFATFGSTTARPCPGNPRPWFQRLPKAKGLMINVGLANEGVEVVEKTVHNAHQAAKTLLVGQSIARTNDAKAADDSEGIEDYFTSLNALAGKTSFIEVNVSCPNTFKGEPFTSPERLDKLLTKLDTVSTPQPITLKMPSDKTWEEFKALLDVASKHNVQGVTLANLRKNREGVQNLDGSACEIPDHFKGNISGRPTRAKSNELIARTYLEYGDRFTIIGLGGAFNARQVYEKIRLGADLVAMVSALMFEGPSVVPLVKRGLVKLLKRDGYKHVSDARGVSAKAYIEKIDAQAAQSITTEDAAKAGGKADKTPRKSATTPKKKVSSTPKGKVQKKAQKKGGTRGNRS